MLIMKMKKGQENEDLTSIREYGDNSWSSITAWTPTALLPIFQILEKIYNI